MWNLLTLVFGLPTSSSHALIGGLVGAAVAHGGWAVVRWGVTAKILSAWLFTLPGAGLLGAGVYALLTSLT